MAEVTRAAAWRALSEEQRTNVTTIAASMRAAPGLLKKHKAFFSASQKNVVVRAAA